MGIPNTSYLEDYADWGEEPPCNITGDHYWAGGTCTHCGTFNGALLNWAKVEKAEVEGRHHGNHYHLTINKANMCKNKTHDEEICVDKGGCLHHDASDKYLNDNSVRWLDEGY